MARKGTCENCIFPTFFFTLVFVEVAVWVLFLFGRSLSLDLSVSHCHYCYSPLDFLLFCDQEKRGANGDQEREGEREGLCESVYVCTLRVLHTRARCVPNHRSQGYDSVHHPFFQ